MFGTTIRRNTAALRRTNVKREERAKEEGKRLEAARHRFIKPTPLIISLLVLDIIPPVQEPTQPRKVVYQAA